MVDARLLKRGALVPASVLGSLSFHYSLRSHLFPSSLLLPFLSLFPGLVPPVPPCFPLLLRVPTRSPLVCFAAFCCPMISLTIPNSQDPLDVSSALLVHYGLS